MRDLPIDRRAALALGALALSAWPARGLAQGPSETVALWPGTPPGGEGLAPPTPDSGPDPDDRHLSGIARPLLTIVRPANPDGSALLIAPGGGYSFEAIDKEGLAPARAFAAKGVTCFVLTYRLPYEGWKNGADAPLADAQRAMRLIRAHTAQYEVDPARVGVLGFSAGGHLAGLLATRAGSPVYAPLDDADTLDARPAFAALLYPVVTMLKPFAHEASCEKLLGEDAPQAARAAYSVERLVTAATAPMFLCAAADDPDVPVDNTLLLYATLRAQGVGAEMHVFEKGGHGFGLGDAPAIPARAWPDLLMAWGAAKSVFRAS